MFQRLYASRFQFFFITQICILFGGLLIPTYLFEDKVAPLLFLLNLIAGLVLISKRKDLFWFFLILILCSTAIFSYAQAVDDIPLLTGYLQYGIYFAFYFMVTYEIIKQVWYAEKVNNTVIYGMISGFISLGLIGFFICMGIELANSGSFEGGLLHLQDSDSNILTEQLLYFSFITLITIGYGDIAPVTPLAQKASILIGLVGQFYLVVLTAIVVGKFINQNNLDTKD